MADDAPELSEHTVKINGIEHTMMLSDEDAQRYQDAEDADNARTGEADASTKAKTPANKAKTSTTSK
jgi:hypothetical protein